MFSGKGCHRLGVIMLTGWQRTWIRILTTLLTVAMMIVIFCFSMENAEQSDQRSGVYANIIISVTHPEYEQLKPEEQQKIYDDTSLIIRKLAHFAEYALLGCLLRLCLESWFGHLLPSVRTLSLVSIMAGAFYAVTDELHQLQTDGRSGQFTDVLVDSCGVISGVVLWALLIGHTWKEKKNGG